MEIENLKIENQILNKQFENLNQEFIEKDN